VPPTPIATLTPTTTVVAAPRLSATAKGKQPARATTPTEPSRQETHISQQRGSGTDEGTGSRPGVLDVPSDDSEEELSWNSFDDEDVDEQTKGKEYSEGDKTDESDDKDETSKIGEQEATESDEGHDEATKSDRESEDEETREQEEESFDPIPRTLKTMKIMTIMRRIKVYGLSDAQQESSSTLSFMTNLLNPITDPGMESIFMTGSTTVTPIPLPQSTMTPSIISTFTLASQLPTPPTQIPSLDLQSLPTFASVFCFEDRVKFLEDNFSNISGIVNQYMHQQMPEAVREAVQTQKNRLQDSIQRENDEFLKTIDENMQKIIKEQAEVLTRSSHSSRTSYAVAADLSKLELKKILIDKMEGNNEDARMMIKKDPPLDQTGGLKDKEREGSMHQLALHLNQLPGVQAELPQGLNLDSCLPMSLLSQRNLCSLPVRWKNPHIRCLKQVRTINPLFKLLSILNGFPNQGDHQHRIVIGTNLCQLLKERSIMDKRTYKAK
nr:hypothetical protein [Tanacetum cinerariifolium]